MADVEKRGLHAGTDQSASGAIFKGKDVIAETDRNGAAFFEFPEEYFI
jgi:hypothetical protein